MVFSTVFSLSSRRHLYLVTGCKRNLTKEVGAFSAFLTYNARFVRRRDESPKNQRLNWWLYKVVFTLGVIHKPRGQIFGYFWPPPPPSWSLLLNMAYIIKWSFGYPLPLNWPRGLWMTLSLGKMIFASSTKNAWYSQLDHYERECQSLNT